MVCFAIFNNTREIQEEKITWNCQLGKKKKKKANTEKVVSFYFPLFQWSDLLYDWFAASSCCANIVKQRSFFSDN